MSLVQCGRCGRTLKSPKARELGYGMVCWRKIMAEQTAMEQKARSNIEIRTTVRDGYAGARGPDGAVKVVGIRNGVQYPLQHLVHHSPSGMEWGYGGSGPADLARSIIGDVLGTDDPDPAVYQDFKQEFVSGWGDRWEISLDEIRAWVKEKGLLKQAAK